MAAGGQHRGPPWWRIARQVRAQALDRRWGWPGVDGRGAGARSGAQRRGRPIGRSPRSWPRDPVAAWRAGGGGLRGSAAGVVTVDQDARRALRWAPRRGPLATGAPLAGPARRGRSMLRAPRSDCCSQCPAHDVYVIGAGLGRPARCPGGRPDSTSPSRSFFKVHPGHDRTRWPPPAASTPRSTPRDSVGVPRRARRGLGLPGRPGRDRDHVPGGPRARSCDFEHPGSPSPATEPGTSAHEAFGGARPPVPTTSPTSPATPCSPRPLSTSSSSTPQRRSLRGWFTDPTLLRTGQRRPLRRRHLPRPARRPLEVFNTKAVILACGGAGRAPATSQRADARRRQDRAAYADRGPADGRGDDESTTATTLAGTGSW